MKIDTKLYLALFALILASISVAISKSTSKNKYFSTPLIKTAKSFLSFANVPYCNKDVINTLACPLCSSILDNSFKVREIIITTYEKREFKAVVLQSDNHKEIVVTFGGPKLKEDPKFYSAVYTLGYENTNKKEKVEKIFTDVYKGEMQTNLQKTLRLIFAEKKRKAKNYNIVFVGHSFGGALATLAAYDLHEAKITGKKNKMKVYTYGPLKIGNIEFIKYMNTKMRLIRIIKNTDLAPVLQNCNYSEVLKKWQCSKEITTLDGNNNSGPPKVSPADESKTYYPTQFAMAYAPDPRRSSFLEIANKVSNSEEGEKQVNVYYGGIAHASYYRTHNHNDDKNFLQHIGTEIIFSEHFKKYQVCSYTDGGNGKCEMNNQKLFDADENKNYFNKKVDDC